MHDYKNTLKISLGWAVLAFESHPTSLPLTEVLNQKPVYYETYQ